MRIGQRNPPASVSSSLVSSREARAQPIAIAATSGRVLSKVAMAPAKPCFGSTSGSPSRFSLGHPAVLEAERRGVRGADAELVLEPLQSSCPGVPLRHHERLDRRASQLLVQGRPDDDVCRLRSPAVT